MLLNKLYPNAWHRLQRIRWVHHLESLGLAFTLMFIVSLAVLNFRVDSAIHEWANFLKHYETANAAARHPVEVFLGLTLATLFVIVETLRWGRRTSKPET